MVFYSKIQQVGFSWIGEKNLPNELLNPTDWTLSSTLWITMKVLPFVFQRETSTHKREGRLVRYHTHEQKHTTTKHEGFVSHLSVVNLGWNKLGGGGEGLQGGRKEQTNGRFGGGSRVSQRREEIHDVLVVEELKRAPGKSAQQTGIRKGPWGQQGAGVTAGMCLCVFRYRCQRRLAK